MKYTNKKKLIAVMALIITAASFGGCNSANTTATIDPEVTSSEIVSSAPVSSEATSSETASSAPMNSEAEKPESEAAPSEATTSSAAEVSSKTEAPATSSEPTVSSVPTAVSQPAVSSAPAATTSQPVSSTATSAPAAKTVSAPAQQKSGSTKAFEDMTIEEQDQWLLDQLNEQLASMEVHDSGIVERHSIESTQPAESDNDDAEHKALEKEKLEQLRQNLQGAQNEQKTEQEVSQTEEQDPETNPTEEQETVSEATGDVYEAIRLINEERAKAGLSALEVDSTMMEMAAVRAKETTVVFDHVRPDGSSCWTIFDEFGVRAPGVGGENIASGPRTAQNVVNAWMNSPGHKANILKEGVSKIGIGYYNGYWAMLVSE